MPDIRRHSRWSLAGLALVAVLAVLGVSRAEAAITVTFNSSPPPILVPQSSPMAVSVNVTSTLDVASVVARVGAVSTNLTPATLPEWHGTMNLTSQPFGNLVVVVTATDVAGATATASRTFSHDELPVITLVAPVANSVARPSIHVMATCTDDNPGGVCMNFGGGVSGAPGIGSGGTNTIDGMLDLSAVDGTATQLIITARGPSGATSMVRVPIFVETSPDLAHVVTLGTRVLDVDDGRFLYIDGGMARIRPRAGGAETVLGPIADRGPTAAFGRLTSTGAVYVSKPGTANPCMDREEAFEWRGSGAATSLGLRCRSNGFEEAWPIAGDWGWWPEGANVIRHNFATGVSTTVTFPPDVGGPFLTGNRFTIAANGDLLRIIRDGNDVRFVRDRAGVQTELGRGTAGGQCNPVFDGTAIAYLHQDSPNDRVAMIRAGMAPLVLGDPLIPQYPFETYDVGGGYVAFTRTSMTSGARQIWRRNPGGSLQNLTPLAADSVIDEVAVNGNLTVITGGQTRYLATDGAGAPQHLGSELGRARFLSDGVYVVIGRSVLRHAGGGVPIDAGVIDASTAVDAGTDDADTDAGGSKPGGGGCAAGGSGGRGALVVVLLAAIALGARRRQRAA